MKDFRREEEINEYFRLSIRHPTCRKGLHFINEIILEERDHVSLNITSVLFALIVFLEIAYCKTPPDGVSFNFKALTYLVAHAH